MRSGLDTNVLVYAHMAAMPEHAKVSAFLAGLLARRDTTLVVTPAVLHEFVHVITDPRRFEPPVSMSEALAVARLYLGRPNVQCLSMDAQCLADALELVEEHALGRKRLADALFAATLLRHGVRQLITRNDSDFRVFSALRLVDPLAAAAP